MPEFRYRAADANGKMTQGTLAASGRDEVLRQLRAQGLMPLALDEANGTQHAASAEADAPRTSATAAAWRRRQERRALRLPDIAALTSELAIMLRAGLALDRALTIAINMAVNVHLKALLEDLLQSVKGGKSLSQALESHRALFGDFYLSMVRAGEMGGQLAATLAQLAEHQERVLELRSNIRSALVYPAILCVVAVLSVVLLLGFVVPQFESLFSDMGEALPLPTRIIVALGHFIADGFPFLVLGAVLLVWAARRALASESGRRWRDARLLALPLFGTITRKYEITRFARAMGTLLNSGVTIVPALGIATQTVGNAVLRGALAAMPTAVKQGGRLAAALEETRLFTPLALNMVRLGEETGRLGDMLLEVARVHEREVQTGIKRLLTLIEPVLLLVLGVVIALIIISILMGILSVNDLAM